MTRDQSRRIFSLIAALLSEKEIQALDKRYLDDFGFNYQKFLKEVVPQEPEVPKVFFRINLFVF